MLLVYYRVRVKVTGKVSKVLLFTRFSDKRLDRTLLTVYGESTLV